MEFVYVVPREELFPHCYPQGLVPFGMAEWEQAPEDFMRTVRERGFFVEREYAERSPGLKQVIPYSIVRTTEKNAESGPAPAQARVEEGVCGERILLLRRLDKGGESRLHDKLSIGVGGHINPQDRNPRDREHDPLHVRR